MKTKEIEFMKEVVKSAKTIIETINLNRESGKVADADRDKYDEVVRIKYIADDIEELTIAIKEYEENNLDEVFCKKVNEHLGLDRVG